MTLRRILVSGLVRHSTNMNACTDKQVEGDDRTCAEKFKALLDSNADIREDYHPSLQYMTLLPGIQAAERAAERAAQSN